MTKQIAVTTTSFARESHAPLDVLEKAGFTVVMNSRGRKLTKPETTDFLKTVDGVIAGTEALDREVLSQLPGLRVISRVGTAMDNVDLAYAKERGIPVFNTPDGPTQGVAELTLGGLLSLLRRIPQSDASIRRGGFEKPMGNLLCGKTVGIIGLGRIGKALVRLLAPFDLTMLAVDPAPDEEFARAQAVRYGSLEEVLPQADVVILHLSGSPKKPLLGAAEFQAMKPGAVIVNAARGGWIDEAALADALKSSRISGAYLDVFSTEPYAGPLTEIPNTVLTAHIGSYALECRVQMELDAAQHVVDFFKNKGGG
jgi:D-3-phosphoglycerate dehydrogenase / 2-oxoglutarate reductase